jgi:hypothetical protein
MSIPSWAKVGAKVVCINDAWVGRSAITIEVGGVYTIAALRMQYGRTFLPDGRLSSGHIVAELVEVKNPYDRFYPETAPGYALSRFRPVKTIEDDISEHFAQHLTVRGSAPVEMAS